MTNKFWDKIAGSYDKNTEKRFSEANEKTIDTSKRYCDSKMKMLDIGCGTGTFTIELSKLVRSVDAIDCSEKMLEIAKQKSSLENISNVDWQCNDVINVLKTGKKYNIITAFNILLYLPDIKQVLSNIYDLLDDDGCFLSVTDCLGETTGFLKTAELFLAKIGIIPKMNRFKTDELEKLISDAGFEILSAENFHQGEPNYYIAARKKKN